MAIISTEKLNCDDSEELLFLAVYAEICKNYTGSTFEREKIRDFKGLAEKFIEEEFDPDMPYAEFKERIFQIVFSYCWERK